MLCTAASSVAAQVQACDASADKDPVTVATPAQPNAQPNAQPGQAPSAQAGTPCSPPAPQAAATLKISARPNAPPSSGKEPPNARDRHAQAGPLLVSALVMLVIALRRGGR